MNIFNKIVHGQEYVSLFTKFYRHCIDINATMEKGVYKWREQKNKSFVVLLIAGCFLSTLNQTLLVWQ